MKQASPKVVPAASPALPPVRSLPPPASSLFRAQSPARALFRAISPVLSAWASASPVPLAPSPAQAFAVPSAGAGRCVLCAKMTVCAVNLHGGPAPCCRGCTKQVMQEAMRPARALCRRDAAAREWGKDVACAKVAVALVLLGMLVMMGMVIADKG